jgi:hypothetical protein
MTQTLNNISTRRNYDLTYHYNVELGTASNSICTFSVAVDGKVVDTFTSLRTTKYLSRTVSLPQFASDTSILKLSLVCPRFLAVAAQNNYALDAITITRTN